MWQTPTVILLRDRLTGPEMTALQRAALTDGQPDPLPGILERAVDEARGYLAARPQANLGPAGTIPPQIMGAVLDIARFRVCTRLSVGSLGTTLLGDARRKEYEDAIALLKDVAAGRFLVEAPEVLTEENIPTAGTPRIQRFNPRRKIL